jgi:4-hydroxy-3-methylbut-2-enyl diphosphate reductase
VVTAALPACRSHTVLLPSPRSFCAGVERAIDIVPRALNRHTGPVHVRKQTVHNAYVVAELERRGAVTHHASARNYEPEYATN